jgi:poly(3-hydroxybutyrate) depolymerase
MVSALSLCAVCGIPWLVTACGGSDPDSDATVATNVDGQAGNGSTTDMGAQAPSGAAGSQPEEEAGAAGSPGTETGEGDSGAAGSPNAPSAGAGGAPDTDPDTDPGSGGWGGDTGDLNAGAPAECQKDIVAGLNEDWEAYGMKRSFFVDFPSNTSVPPALVFSFHGFGDNPSHWRQGLGLDPDTDPSFPMIIVTPESTHLQPVNLGNAPQGLDWDLANGGHEYENRDVVLVQSILGCLKKQNGVDVDRIYSVGFSAGSVFSALLHSRFQHDFAAIVAMSGMWFNDTAQRKLINPLVPMNFSWDDLDPQFGGNVLLSHGGPSDAIVILGVPIVSIEESANAAFPFLSAAGRTVVDCPHSGGHTIPQTFSRQQMVSFLKAHRRGQPSPYLAGGLDSSLDSACSLREPQ